MLTRKYGYLWDNATGDVSDATRRLETSGACVVKGVFDEDAVAQLREAIDEVFAVFPADRRSEHRAQQADQQFRYEMLNRSSQCLKAVANSIILSTIEPLLGEDCHVIANTAWRNPPNPNDSAQPWHVDGGPHIPLPADVLWPPEIPHPVFAIGCHILLQDCALNDGPTGFIPGSHLSGRPPPYRQALDANLTYQGQGAVPLTGEVGDVLLFVSDVWHRRMPTGANDRGRYFLQVHYARRDIQQRLKTSDISHQLSDSILSDLDGKDNSRLRTLVGLHSPGFYDG